MVSQTVAPTDDPERWERGNSPWHKDGFPDELKDQAPEQTEKPSTGWYELDWCKNLIGFVPDGFAIEIEKE